MFLTFFASAYWHGIYIAYYIGFLHWGALLYLSKLIFRRRALFDFLGRLKTPLAWYFGMLIMHYTAGFICVLVL